jgi:hypothetical protein
VERGQLSRDYTAALLHFVKHVSTASLTRLEMLVDEDNVNGHQAVIKRLERFVNLREVIIRSNVFNGQELQTGVDNILRLPSIRKVSLVKFCR